MNLKVSPTHAASDETQWRYPCYPGHPPAPRGCKLNLLNKGKVSVVGHWSDDMLAWAPLIKRNQKIEDWLEAQHGA